MYISRFMSVKIPLAVIGLLLISSVSPQAAERGGLWDLERISDAGYWLGQASGAVGVFRDLGESEWLTPATAQGLVGSSIESFNAAFEPSHTFEGLILDSDPNMASGQVGRVLEEMRQVLRERTDYNDEGPPTTILDASYHLGIAASLAGDGRSVRACGYEMQVAGINLQPGHAATPVPNLWEIGQQLRSDGAEVQNSSNSVSQMRNNVLPLIQQRFNQLNTAVLGYPTEP